MKFGIVSLDGGLGFMSKSMESDHVQCFRVIREEFFP